VAPVTPQRNNEQTREALGKREKKKIPLSKGESANGDDKATAEAKAISTGDLEKTASENEHGRTERFRNHVAYAILGLFWVVFVCVILSGTVWFYHLIFPEKWHFLTSAQVEKIGNQLFGGVVSVFISGYAKKRLN
jgi:hypothetical protein